MNPLPFLILPQIPPPPTPHRPGPAGLNVPALPLWEVAGPEGPIQIYVSFSLSGLSQIEHYSPKYA